MNNKPILSLLVLLAFFATSGAFCQTPKKSADAWALLAGKSSKTWKLVDFHNKADPATSIFSQSDSNITQMKLAFFSDRTFHYQYPDVKPVKLKLKLAADGKTATFAMGPASAKWEISRLTETEFNYSDQYYIYHFTTD